MPLLSCLRQSIIEVERKFQSTPATIAAFRANSGHPPFACLQLLRNHDFLDTYYDTATSALSRRGIYLRQRTGPDVSTGQANDNGLNHDSGWQAKVRRGGHFTNSQFEELSTRAEIVALLSDLQANTSDGTTATAMSTPRESYVRQNDDALVPIDVNAPTFGMPVWARFVTFREQWLADSAFKVVFDRTDFGHAVGEVELEQAVLVDDEAIGGATSLRAASIKMDGRVEEFMRRYAWAFPATHPVGKLSAYFALKGLPRS